MDSRVLLIAVVLILSACKGSLTEGDVEKALRNQVSTTKSVTVHKIIETEGEDKGGCNPMFDGSTYAVHVTHVADMGECPRIKILQSICGENKSIEENLCFKEVDGKWVYSRGQVIFPHAEWTPR